MEEHTNLSPIRTVAWPTFGLYREMHGQPKEMNILEGYSFAQMQSLYFKIFFYGTTVRNKLAR
jgi:hypothetical protein